MTEIAVPEQLNSESHVHHPVHIIHYWCASSTFFFIEATEKNVQSKNPQPLPLYTELTLICLWVEALQCQLKLYHFSSRGSSNTFPVPEATHSSLDPVLSPLRTVFSRAHTFFMGYFFLCLPHEASLQNFVTGGSGAKSPGSYEFPPARQVPSQATHISWWAACTSDLLSR